MRGISSLDLGSLAQRATPFFPNTVVGHNVVRQKNAQTDTVMLMLLPYQLRRRRLYKMLPKSLGNRITALSVTTLDGLYHCLPDKEAAIAVIDVSYLNGLEPGRLGNALIVVVGGTNQEALFAFEKQAHGFIQYPFVSEQVTNCFMRINATITEQLQREQRCRLFQLLAKQKGMSLDALDATLNQRVLQCNPLSHYVTLRAGNTRLYVNCDDIKYIEAAGDYMCVHLNTETQIIRSTLTDLAKKLPEDVFAKVNRSVMVNLHRVVKRVDQRQGHYVELDEGTQLKISRRYFTQYWQHFV